MAKAGLVILAVALLGAAGCGEQPPPKSPAAIKLGGSQFYESDETVRYVLSGREACVAIMQYMERQGVEVGKGHFVYQIECRDEDATVVVLLTPGDHSHAPEAKGGE